MASFTKSLRAGSIESSDLSIEATVGEHSIEIRNLISDIDDSLLREVIAKNLKEQGLLDVRVKISYNGANEWVIKSRCEAIKALIKEKICAEQ